VDTISSRDVQEAATRIAGRVRRTPVLPVAPGRRLTSEQLQHTGSFKARGAFDGNCGPVNGTGCRGGVRAADRTGGEGGPVAVVGADVRPVGSEYAQAYEAAVEFAETNQAVFCHAYDQPEIAAGAAGRSPGWPRRWRDRRGSSSSNPSAPPRCTARWEPVNPMSLL
jgi:threonine dehydratase